MVERLVFKSSASDRVWLSGGVKAGLEWSGLSLSWMGGHRGQWARRAALYTRRMTCLGDLAARGRSGGVLRTGQRARGRADGVSIIVRQQDTTVASVRVLGSDVSRGRRLEPPIVMTWRAWRAWRRCCVLPFVADWGGYGMLECPSRTSVVRSIG